MPAEITYWGRRSDAIAAPYSLMTSETLATSGSSAQSATAPEDADLVSIVCTTAAIRIASGINPTADSSSAYVCPNERIWLTSYPGLKLAAVNA